MVIDTLSEKDRAIVDARVDRLGELELKDLVGEDLSPDERNELMRLDAWHKTMPPDLVGLDDEEIELRKLFAEDDCPLASAPTKTRHSTGSR